MGVLFIAHLLLQPAVSHTAAHATELLRLSSSAAVLVSTLLFLILLQRATCQFFQVRTLLLGVYIQNVDRDYQNDSCHHQNSGHHENHPDRHSSLPISVCRGASKCGRFLLTIRVECNRLLVDVDGTGPPSSLAKCSTRVVRVFAF